MMESQDATKQDELRHKKYCGLDYGGLPYIRILTPIPDHVIHASALADPRDEMTCHYNLKWPYRLLTNGLLTL